MVTNLSKLENDFSTILLSGVPENYRPFIAATKPNVFIERREDNGLHIEYRNEVPFNCLSLYCNVIVEVSAQQPTSILA